MIDEDHKQRLRALLKIEACYACGWSPDDRKSVKWALGTIEALESQAGDLRAALAAAGISLLGYDASYGGGGGCEEAFDIAKLLGYDGNQVDDDIAAYLRAKGVLPGGTDQNTQVTISKEWQRQVSELREAATRLATVRSESARPKDL